MNDLPVGRSVDETLRLIEAFQFTVCIPCIYLFAADVPQEEHGEVCPANWTAGAKTIKADPAASLEYFSTVDEAATNGHGTNGHTNGSAKKRARTD